MRRIERATAFKRDYRRIKATSRYRDLGLMALLELLVDDRPLPPRNRDHALSGDWSGYRDCHLWPDLLLIYAKPSPDVLRLVGRPGRGWKDTFAVDLLQITRMRCSISGVMAILGRSPK
jgi:mRNA interferase YafQ